MANVGINIFLNHQMAHQPTRSDPGSAGYDLYSVEKTIVNPGKRALVNTGIMISFPSDLVGKIAPRSGLALNNGIDVLAGIIDSSYRGDIKVLLINFDDVPFTVDPGMRIAQIIFQKIEIPNNFAVFDNKETFLNSSKPTTPRLIQSIGNNSTGTGSSNFISKTPRGTGGFGSSGTK